MKKNLYYHATFRRGNAIKFIILSFFLAIASYPRLLLEVFIRKNMGVRYFSISTAIILAVILAFIPVLVHKVYSYDFIDAIVRFPTWYLFIAAFLYMSFVRHREIALGPSVFDFAKFTLSTGETHPFFDKLSKSIFPKKQPNFRTNSILLEPGVFFIIGIALSILGQIVGVLIIICSICYSLGYAGAFYNGDNFIMDKIDELICSEELIHDLVSDDGNSEREYSRGFQFFGEMPADSMLRKKVVTSFFEDDNKGDNLAQ